MDTEYRGRYESQHCVRATWNFLHISKTLAVTEATNVDVSKTGKTLPDRSEVSLAATTPCRLQLQLS
jgi:hypothetical protein